MNRFIGTNVSEFAHTPPESVIVPESIDEVRALVRERVATDDPPLRVVSSGFNWGLGSASSPGPVSNLLALHRLNSIRSMDLDRGHAVIEAGVTQDQLHDYRK